ncbi:MAG: universal stress protein [Solirubrobacteraceae bacterium]
MGEELRSGEKRPALLCFDGSADAVAAIEQARRVLSIERAVVLSVCEPLPGWEPYDPLTALSAPLSRLASRALDLDEICEQLTGERMREGLSLARAAGFAAEGRTARGKPWRVICHVAEELDAAAIVLGARGLGRVGSLLLGSVSFAVAAHAKRPLVIVPTPGDSGR